MSLRKYPFYRTFSSSVGRFEPLAGEGFSSFPDTVDCKFKFCRNYAGILEYRTDYPDVAFRMAPLCARNCKAPYYGNIAGSFMAMMAAAHADESTLPEAYLLTMNSTIPVADAIRGFHAQKELPEPLLLPIRDKKYGVDIFDINPDVAKGKRVLLVDEYFFNGESVHRAQARAYNVGQVATIMSVTDMTEWYEQAYYIGEDDARTNSNLINMTSPYDKFMYNQGRRVARFLSDPGNSEWIKQFTAGYQWVDRSEFIP